MPPIINSLLDTDLYKFTMLQAVLHQFPRTHSVYEFRCRNWQDLPLSLHVIETELNTELDHLCSLKFRADELAYLRGLRFIKSDFVDYLELFQLKRRFVTIKIDSKKRLNIRVEGPMIQAMFFEIFILAIVSELYYQKLGVSAATGDGQKRLEDKVAALKEYQQKQDSRSPFVFSDFGTRRRFSRVWQQHVVETLQKEVPVIFKGTSNVYLAKLFNIYPIGTMAHEFLQAFQALNVRLRDFQQAALESWVQEYRGDLGVALTDVVGSDAFFRDFDLYFAKLFDGLRHDSGDPYAWGDKAYRHYQNLRIEPATKMLTFSDGLNIHSAWEIYLYFKDRFKLSFGIGTNLTNDLGYLPLNIVLKLVECNGQPVIKISDSPGKIMATDKAFLAYLKSVFALN